MHKYQPLEPFMPEAESLKQNDAGEGVTVRRAMHCSAAKVPSLERERVAHKPRGNDAPEGVNPESLPHY